MNSIQQIVQENVVDRVACHADRIATWVNGDRPPGAGLSVLRHPEEGEGGRPGAHIHEEDQVARRFVGPDPA